MSTPTFIGGLPYKRKDAPLMFFLSIFDTLFFEYE
jgi:hypothetical protein